MPTYEYVCRACEHRFELRQRFSDEPVNSCPRCGSEVRRVLFPVGIVYKGSGFYSTDYSHSSVGTVRRSDNGDEAKADDKVVPDTNSEASKEKATPIP